MATAKVTAMDLFEGDEVVVYIQTLSKKRGEPPFHSTRLIVKIIAKGDHLALIKLSDDETNYPIVFEKEK